MAVLSIGQQAYADVPTPTRGNNAGYSFTENSTSIPVTFYSSTSKNKLYDSSTGVETTNQDSAISVSIKEATASNIYATYAAADSSRVKGLTTSVTNRNFINVSQIDNSNGTDVTNGTYYTYTSGTTAQKS